MYRHPYSFIGDSKVPVRGRLGEGHVPEGQEPLWGETMAPRVWTPEGKMVPGRSPKTGELLPSPRSLQLSQLAAQAGIKMDYEVRVQWQPVDSQRLLLWAARFGKQEAFMSALARRHFEERKSASHRATLLEAAEEAGLGKEAEVLAFLETEELREQVWHSYKETIARGVRSIPFFIFSHQGLVYGVHGSSDFENFLRVFEQIRLHAAAAEEQEEEATKPPDTAPAAARL